MNQDRKSKVHEKASAHTLRARHPTVSGDGWVTARCLQCGRTWGPPQSHEGKDRPLPGEGQDYARLQEELAPR